MVRQFRVSAFVFIISLSIIAQAGCLNLGGRTTYVQEKPETAGRLTALETRVSALEQALSTTSHISHQSLRTPDEETSPGMIGN